MLLAPKVGRPIDSIITTHFVIKAHQLRTTRAGDQSDSGISSVLAEEAADHLGRISSRRVSVGKSKVINLGHVDGRHEDVDEVRWNWSFKVFNIVEDGRVLGSYSGTGASAGASVVGSVLLSEPSAPMPTASPQNVEEGAGGEGEGRSC